MPKINNVEFLTLPQQVNKNKKDITAIEANLVNISQTLTEHETAIDDVSADIYNVSETVDRELTPLSPAVQGFTYDADGNTFTHSGLWESGEMLASEVINQYGNLTLKITPLTQNMVIIYRLYFDGPSMDSINLVIDGVYAPVSPEKNINYKIEGGKTLVYDVNPATGGGGPGYFVVVGINGCMVSCTSGFAW